MNIETIDNSGGDQQPRKLIDFLTDETHVFEYILPIFAGKLMSLMEDKYCQETVTEIGKLIISQLSVKDKSEICTERFIDDVRHRILSARNSDEQAIHIRQLCDRLINRITRSDSRLFQIKHFHKTKLSRALIFWLIYYMALAVSEDN